MLAVLIWILLGGLVGCLAGMVVRSPSFSCLGDVIVGITGALLGGIVLTLLLPGEYSFSGLNLGSLLMAVLGAIILLLILRAVGWGTRGSSL